MRRWAGDWFGPWFGLALLATNAGAQPNAGAEPARAAPLDVVLEVELAPGSEACPNKERVFQAIQRLFPEHEFRQGSTESSRAARAHVTIRPLPEGHEAVLTLLPPARGERVIREKDQDCRGLADALALAFVMLVAPPEPSESESAEGVPPRSEPASGGVAVAPQPKPAVPESERRAPERLPEAPRARAKSYRAGVGASVIGGIGVLSEPALGAAGEIELFHRSGWGLSIQGLRLWAEPAEAQGGRVTLTLWGVLAAPCYQQPLSARAALVGCLRFGIGAQHALAEGFAAADSGNFPWQVLVPSVSYRQTLPGLGGPLSAFVRVGFVAQLRPQSFSVREADGAGDNVPIATAPKFGVMADIGLMFGTGPF